MFENQSMKIPSRSDIVIERITALILSNQWPIGKILPPEKKLCDMFGVSRSILREAVKVLASRGLLQVKQGFGTVVCSPKDDAIEEALITYMTSKSFSLHQIIEVRAPLEVAIAKLAAERGTEEHLKKMADTFDVLSTEGKSLDEYTAADAAFHQGLIDAAGNKLFKIFINSIMQYLEMSRRLTIHHFGLKLVFEGHKAIYDAVADQNVETAAKSMEAHMSMTAKNIAIISALAGESRLQASVINADLLRPMFQSKSFSKDTNGSGIDSE
jgi:GntR family transcriptional repressor for pyruvate dehydrogenase complex